jgi:hypothetical protein
MIHQQTCDLRGTEVCRAGLQERIEQLEATVGDSRAAARRAKEELAEFKKTKMEVLPSPFFTACEKFAKNTRKPWKNSGRCKISSSTLPFSRTFLACSHVCACSPAFFLQFCQSWLQISCLAVDQMQALARPLDLHLPFLHEIISEQAHKICPDAADY